MPTNFTTPGVYINEISAFPNSVSQVPTAVPAFIGYTARASYNGKSYLGVPVRIETLAEFMAYFGVLDPADPTGRTYLPECAQYAPTYYLLPNDAETIADVTLGGQSFNLEPDPNTVYYLYNSIKLFYANGGGTCYVVSVGVYGAPKGQANALGAPVVNGNMSAQAIVGALTTLQHVTEPTMIVVPDATLLSAADNQIVNQQVLAHCQLTQSRVGIIDVVASGHLRKDVQVFRSGIGQTNLKYGAAYYPFLKTSIMADNDINYTNIANAGPTLSKYLPGAASGPLAAIIARIGNTDSKSWVDSCLRNASTDYARLHDALLAKINILPPSAAMAGVYTTVDNTEGVWKAPANVSLSSVTDVTVPISTVQQGEYLNVDASTGKSINAIRGFYGRGVIVWGARTLDGNSDDWRYVNIRRTMICVEQSIKEALNAYVFQPNTANTWSLITSMLNNFLTNLWRQGALVGATPAEAFSVACGLGATMSSQDILNGVLNVSVKVAPAHPAEFIVLTFQQQMQTS